MTADLFWILRGRCADDPRLMDLIVEAEPLGLGGGTPVARLIEAAESTDAAAVLREMARDVGRSVPERKALIYAVDVLEEDAADIRRAAVKAIKDEQARRAER